VLTVGGDLLKTVDYVVGCEQKRFITKDTKAYILNLSTIRNYADPPNLGVVAQVTIEFDTPSSCLMTKRPRAAVNFSSDIQWKLTRHITSKIRVRCVMHVLGLWRKYTNHTHGEESEILRPISNRYRWSNRLEIDCSPDHASRLPENQRSVSSKMLLRRLSRQSFEGGFWRAHYSHPPSCVGLRQIVCDMVFGL